MEGANWIIPIKYDKSIYQSNSVSFLSLSLGSTSLIYAGEKIIRAVAFLWCTFWLSEKTGAAVQQGLPAVFTVGLWCLYQSSPEDSPAALGFLNLK